MEFSIVVEILRRFFDKEIGCLCKLNIKTSRQTRLACFQIGLRNTLPTVLCDINANPRRSFAFLEEQADIPALSRSPWTAHRAPGRVLQFGLHGLPASLFGRWAVVVHNNDGPLRARSRTDQSARFPCGPPANKHHFLLQVIAAWRLLEDLRIARSDRPCGIGGEVSRPTEPT